MSGSGRERIPCEHCVACEPLPPGPGRVPTCGVNPGRGNVAGSDEAPPSTQGSLRAPSVARRCAYVSVHHCSSLHRRDPAVERATGPLGSSIQFMPPGARRPPCPTSSRPRRQGPQQQPAAAPGLVRFSRVSTYPVHHARNAPPKASPDPTVSTTSTGGSSCPRPRSLIGCRMPAGEPRGTPARDRPLAGRR